MQSRHYAGNTFLAGSKVLITGATTPLGRSCAFRFAELNCRLILLGPDEHKLQMLGEDLAKAARDLPMSSGPKQLEFVKLDVNDAEQIRQLGNHVGQIDSLINLVGSPDQSEVEYGRTSDPAERMRLIYESASAFVSAFAPQMKARGSGHIINVVVSGRHGNSPDFASLQQALSAYTVASRHDLVNSAIRVTAVAPAPTETRNGQIPELDTEDVADQVVFCATRAKHVQIADISSHSMGGIPSNQPHHLGQPQFQEMQNGQNGQDMPPNRSHSPSNAAKPQAPQVSSGTQKFTTARKNIPWEVEIAELKRRQKKEHGVDIFEGNDKEKHTPYLTIQGNIGTVIIGKGVEGNPYHPMKASEDPDEVHFIANIWVVDQNGKCVAMEHLNPVSQDKAEMTFQIPSWATKLKPYEFCNKHGLWDGPDVIVPQNVPMAKVLKGSTNPNAWRSIIADLHRLQKKLHSKATAFLGNDAEKHTPYLTFHGEKMMVTVGNGNPYHPMKDSTDPAEVHYIQYIYVLDQDNNCVAMESLDPTGCEIAQVEFDIPRGTSKLMPYEYCNLHGLWSGPTVEVPAKYQQRHAPMEVIPQGRTMKPNHPDPRFNMSPNGRSNQMGAMTNMMNAMPTPMNVSNPMQAFRTDDRWDVIVHPDGLRVYQPKRSTGLAS